MKNRLLPICAAVSMVIGGGVQLRGQAGVWTNTGAMAQGRIQAASTTLKDGRVFVVGGDAYINRTRTYFSSAEIFDPVTGVWSSAGSMSQALQDHRAITLQDGRVLVTGGSGPGVARNKAELYDPATNSWSYAANMHFNHELHTMTLLNDGRVLVVGGTEATIGSGHEGIVEIYDPSTNVWSMAANTLCHSPRKKATATLLPNGNVMVVGGELIPGLAEIYDPNADTWSYTGSGPTYLSNHTATLLANGKVLVEGGEDSNSVPRTGSYIYDPDSNSWSPGGVLNQGRCGALASRLPDGKVLIAGCSWLSQSTSDASNSCEVYDPDTNVWTNGPSLTWAHQDGVIACLLNGQILFAGGIDSIQGYVTTALLFTETSRKWDWTTTGALSERRDSAAFAILGNGKVLMAGGERLDSPMSGTWTNLASVGIYDPVTGAWSPAASLSEPRLGAVAVTLQNGKTLIVGGQHTNATMTELYDSATNTWSITAPMIRGRENHVATLLSDGRVLVAGGQLIDGGLAGVEIYDPKANAWSPATNMAQPRYYATATLLNNGKVLVAGGLKAPGVQASPELYDPATNSWSPAGVPAGPLRYGHTATLLANGKVLVAGGINSTYGTVSCVTVTELYDPKTNTWSGAGILSNGRNGATACRLSDGKVMVAGGAVDLVQNGTVSHVFTDTTEIYDPVAGTWSNGASMPDARVSGHLFDLYTGRALMVGGWSNGYGPEPAVFLYTPVVPETPLDPQPAKPFLSQYIAASYSFSGNMNDQGPHGLNGVNHGATLTTDRLGNANSAYYFNGSAYIDIPGGSVLNGMSSFTLSAWIKTDVANQGAILSKVYPNRDFVLDLSTGGGGSANAHWANGGTYYHCWATSPKVPANAWTHLAAVWTGTSWQLYINGSLSMQTVFSGVAPLWTGNLLQIGTLSSYTSMPVCFKGTIDEVRIYSKALSQSEISTVMAQ
jgi:N-acetylneuraminic acid mutarotase